LRAQLRVDRRHAQAAADQRHMAHLVRVGGQAQRPSKVSEFVALAVVLEHVAGGPAQRLNDQGDRPALAIEVGNRQRNALAIVAQPQHHELAGLGGAGHIGGVHLPQESSVRKLLAANDADHATSCEPQPGS